jgi:hypothetical protein
VVLDEGGGEEGFGGGGAVAFLGDGCTEFGYAGEREGGSIYIFYEGDSHLLHDLQESDISLCRQCRE